MTDPKRLIDGEDEGAVLLGSARSDRPRRSARDRAAAAVGLAMGLGAATTKAASSAPDAPGPSDAAGVGRSSSTRIASGATWLKIAASVLALAALAGLVVAARSPLRAPRLLPTEVTPSAPTRTTPPSSPPPQSAAGEPKAANLANAGSRRGGAERTRGNSAPANADPPLESALAREVRLLDAARVALASDPAAAVAALDRYDHAFPGGALRTEASMIRVEALLARGNAVEARKLARDLIAQDPSGPHARRLRAIVENP